MCTCNAWSLCACAIMLQSYNYTVLCTPVQPLEHCGQSHFNQQVLEPFVGSQTYSQTLESNRPSLLLLIVCKPLLMTVSIFDTTSYSQTGRGTLFQVQQRKDCISLLFYLGGQIKDTLEDHSNVISLDVVADCSTEVDIDVTPVGEEQVIKSSSISTHVASAILQHIIGGVIIRCMLRCNIAVDCFSLSMLESLNCLLAQGLPHPLSFPNLIRIKWSYVYVYTYSLPYVRNQRYAICTYLICYIRLRHMPHKELAWRLTMLLLAVCQV